MSKTVNLHYVVTNGGDGSASVHFVKSNKHAEIYDEFKQYHEGWGEGEAFSEILDIDEDGNVISGLTDVRESLEEIVKDKYYNDRDRPYVEQCKKWLAQLDAYEAEQEQKKEA
jgi:hypothetical protein